MAKPISVSPSQAWLGNDGPWSTFNIRVGTPSQNIWVTPSTSVPETWVVLDAGCISSDPPSCPDDRGYTFQPEDSGTWEPRGLYQISAQSNLGYDPSNAGEYGLDTLGLGYRGAGGPTLDEQVIAGIATKDFYLGSLGLAPAPINFTSEDSRPSLLTTLKARNLIPSLSYGYSAGANYRLKKVDGTLTLGGYDASRFTPNDVEFTLASDISRDLVVGVQSIRFSDSQTTNEELLPDGILAFIDSGVPHIWLPLSSCRAFEKAFGITYDDTTDLYLVNDTLHERLLSQNASITFTLGNNVVGGRTVEITLPYLSFDLQADYKFLNESSRYFPLRRADNDTQYTLGRAFLQESYLTVNYERSNFSVSQSIFPEKAEPMLIPILSSNASLDNFTPSSASKKLPTGAIAGIVVGVVFLAILAIGVFFFVLRRRRRGKISLSNNNIHDQVELDGIAKPAEADDAAIWKPKLEMEGRESPIGFPGKRGQLAEFPGSAASAEMEGSGVAVEMQSGEYPAAVELDAGPMYIHEFPSPNTTTEDSIPSGRGTPLSLSHSRRRQLSPTNLRSSRPLGADSRDISPPSSHATHQHPIVSPNDAPVQSVDVGPEETSDGRDDQAEVEARRESTKREKWRLRRRREE